MSPETISAAPLIAADGNPPASRKRPIARVRSTPVLVGPADFLKQRPKRVAMVGLGPSANAFWLENSQFNEPVPYDSVWVVNRAAVSFRHDASFDMHDLREMVVKYPNEQRRFATADRPIITLAHYPEFPQSVAFPIPEVLAYIKHDILNSTPAYMVAYAMMIGVKELYLYGMDFHYENLDRAEAGGQGMAYMLGMCQAVGINYRIPNTSSLLDAYRVHIVDVGGTQTPMRPLYGYSESETSKDPRIPEGAKVITLFPGNVQMSAHQPRYRLGEAEVGDRAAGG